MEEVLSELRAVRSELSELRSQLLIVNSKLGERLLTRKQAAACLGISTRTLDAWARRGKIVPVEGVPGTRYDPRSLPINNN